MIAFRSASTAGNGSDVNLTVAAPAGMASGDLGIAICSVLSDCGPISASGWTKLFQLPFVNGPSAGEVAVFTREASGAHSAAFTWDGDNAWRSGAILTYSGYAGEAISVETLQTDGWNEHLTFPSIDVPGDDALLLCLCASMNAVAPTDPPSGMTERVEFAELYAAELAVDAGATGVKTTTIGGGGNQTNVQASVAISPVPAYKSSIKAGGAFGLKPVLVKSGGTFADKPLKVKVGGAFV